VKHLHPRDLIQLQSSSPPPNHRRTYRQSPLVIRRRLRQPSLSMAGPPSSGRPVSRRMPTVSNACGAPILATSSIGRPTCRWVYRKRSPCDDKSHIPRLALLVSFKIGTRPPSLLHLTLVLDPLLPHSLIAHKSHPHCCCSILRCTVPLHTTTFVPK
jgi:hypothetical protein